MSNSADMNVGLWLDETSEGRDNAHWIVSLDNDDTSVTLASFGADEYAAALEWAQKESAKREIPFEVQS